MTVSVMYLMRFHTRDLQIYTIEAGLSQTPFDDIARTFQTVLDNFPFSQLLTHESEHTQALSATTAQSNAT